MIEISLTMALALYSMVLLLITMAIWLYTEIAAFRTYRGLERQNLWKCSYCAYSYLDSESERISECPRCGSFNAKEDKGARFFAIRSRAPERPGGVSRPEAEAPEPRRNPSRRKRSTSRSRGPRRRGR